MRVALLGPYPSGRTGLAGGVEAVVRSLAEGLASRPDIELHVITSVPGLLRQGSEHAGALTLHKVPHPRGDRLLWHQTAVWPVRSALSAIRPDVVHAHMAGHYADAALRCGRPAVVTLHGVVFREASLALAHSGPAARARWLLDAAYERWIVRRARDLVAISPYVEKEYRALTRARFHGIENPVADQFFAVSERIPQPVGSAPRLLCPARVIPRKDILTLLRVFAAVREVVPEVRLEIAGQTDADPTYMQQCLRTADLLGVGQHTEFLGNVGPEMLVEAYDRSDIVLLTSRQETAPVTVAEAMASGRPVVSTRAGGVPYMITQGTTGFTADVGDVDGLAAAVIGLLADPELRKRMGAEARRQAAERFRIEAVTARTAGLYLRLLEGGPT